MIFEKKNHRLSRRHAVGSGPCRITPLSGPNGWLTVSGWTDGPAYTDGTPSGPLGLRRRHSWPDGPVAGRPWWRATPTAPIFGRRRSIWPSAQGFFPVVLIVMRLLYNLLDSLVTSGKKKPITSFMAFVHFTSSDCLPFHFPFFSRVCYPFTTFRPTSLRFWN
jgi:hypothetical protein